MKNTANAAQRCRCYLFEKVLFYKKRKQKKNTTTINESNEYVDCGLRIVNNCPNDFHFENS